MAALEDPHAVNLQALIESLLEAPGEFTREVRAAMVHRGEGPTDFQRYIDTVGRNAYNVTDHMVQELKNRGYTEDQIFEATVCAAVHAALVRLNAGIGALEEVD
jgi:hypothetical protein